jgi:3-hydroxy-9,10-secoandrosta-1,3,5(10)-triene-9,17-dione monooxygenase reductase component
VSTTDIERLHQAAPVTADLLRRVCGHFVTGVTVVTSGLGERSIGTTVNSFTSVSLEPPLVLFCLHNKSRLRDVIEDTRAYVVNFLEGRQEKLAQAFAGTITRQSGYPSSAKHWPSSSVSMSTLSTAVTTLSSLAT